MKECGAGISAVLLYTSPVFIIFLSVIFFREKLSLLKIIALVMTFAGCVLVSGIAGGNEHSVSAKGIILGLCSGLGYGLYSIFGTVALKKYRTLTLTFYTFLFAFISMIPLCNFSVFADIAAAGEIDRKLIFYSLGIAVVTTVLPFNFYTIGLKKLDAGLAGILATVEPLTATIVGILIWGESPDIYIVLGMIMILSTIFLCTGNPVKRFLKRHNFKSRMVVDEILMDMRNPDRNTRGQDMFRTWINVPEKKPVNEKVIVIDAGGTNFRSCLVTFDGEGKASVSDFMKNSMPAIDREYSKQEFFEAIADRIDYLRGKADRIGFCFSYAMNITKYHDGIPNAFSKEIKAREVLGVPVGKSLVEELTKRGWPEIKKISVMNDTVSALMAGACSPGDYSSYIGFILGTGMNGAFVDENNSFGDGRQIIVCENGKCNTVELSDFDIEADKKCDIPGQYPLEKCCSGAYLGKACFEMICMASKEKLFSKKTCEKLLKLTELTTIQVSEFLEGKKENVIYESCVCDSDRRICFEILDSAVDRTAHYAASILTACLISCGKGKIASGEKNVCILLNGTTLFKTYHLRERMEKYLFEYATKKTGIGFTTVVVENDITLGSAVAATVD